MTTMQQPAHRRFTFESPCSAGRSQSLSTQTPQTRPVSNDLAVVEPVSCADILSYLGCQEQILKQDTKGADQHCCHVSSLPRGAMDVHQACERHLAQNVNCERRSVAIIEQGQRCHSWPQERSKFAQEILCVSSWHHSWAYGAIHRQHTGIDAWCKDTFEDVQSAVHENNRLSSILKELRRPNAFTSTRPDVYKRLSADACSPFPPELDAVRSPIHNQQSVLDPSQDNEKGEESVVFSHVGVWC